MQCNAMQCNALECNAMYCNAMQCNAIKMQCNATQCNANAKKHINDGTAGIYREGEQIATGVFGSPKCPKWTLKI